MFLKTRRKKFVEQHSVLPDEDFLREVGARSDLARFVTAARRAVAEICDLPPEAIHPADAPVTLAGLATLDWDELQVIMGVESELGASLGEGLDAPRFLPGRFFWRSWPAPDTFGEWVIQFAEWANKALETNCRPASPLDARRHFERAVHARPCVSGGSRSARSATCLV